MTCCHDRKVDARCEFEIYEDDPCPDYGGYVSGWSRIDIFLDGVFVGDSNQFQILCKGTIWRLWQYNDCFDLLEGFVKYTFCNWFPIEIVSIIMDFLNSNVAPLYLVSTCPCTFLHHSVAYWIFIVRSSIRKFLFFRYWGSNPGQSGESRSS